MNQRAAPAWRRSTIAEKLSALLREARVYGNSTDPKFHDLKADVLEEVARERPDLASDALTFAARARARARQLRSHR